MNRTRVTSSNIAEVGYDEISKTLEILFRSGGLYQYFDVPSKEYSGLMKANSHGKYFIARIKGKYRYKRIRSRRILNNMSN